MRKVWGVAFATGALLIAASAPADAVINTCNGGTFVVATAADATAIADGYNNNACDVIINTSITPTNNIFRIQARTITVQGPDVLNAGQPVAIVNTPASSEVQLTASGGPIVIDQASIKATGKVDIKCTQAGCPITVTTSELIASSTLAFGGPGGILLVTADGNLSVTGTAVWGGQLVKFTSVNGMVTFLCTTGGTACKDPTIPPFPPILLAKCGDPPVFPCPNLSTLSQAEVRSICIGTPGVNCGGGSAEFDILAKLDIHIENSVIGATNILVISSKDGRVFGSGADITSVKLTVQGKGDGAAPPVVDFKDASITTVDSLRIVALGCPPAASVCIDLTGATIEGDPVTIAANNGNGTVRACKNGSPGTGGIFTETGGGFPSINGVGAPPYTKNTIATDAQCAPDAGGTFN